MKKLPKFRFRSRGPLRPDEHDACSNQLGVNYGEMIQLMEGTHHTLKGRLQRFRGADCPCMYVFYDEASFNDEQRGIMYFLQDLEFGGFEVVFRQWKGLRPINAKDWRKLRSRDHDDRYGVCSTKKNNWRWRAFQIRSKSDFEHARGLVAEAKATFEDIYSEAL